MWTYTHVAKQVILNKEQPFWDMDSLGAFLNCSKEQLERLQKGSSSGMRMFYKTFYINKDTKKIVPWSTSLRLREINAPVSFLKGFQNRLAVWFSGFPKHPANFAFMEGRNILKAAEEVKDGGVLIHVDLKDFFESQWQVYKELGVRDSAEHYKQFFFKVRDGKLYEIQTMDELKDELKNNVIANGRPEVKEDLRASEAQKRDPQFKAQKRHQRIYRILLLLILLSPFAIGYYRKHYRRRHLVREEPQSPPPGCEPTTMATDEEDKETFSLPETLILRRSLADGRRAFENTTSYEELNAMQIKEKELYDMAYEATRDVESTLFDSFKEACSTLHEGLELNDQELVCCFCTYLGYSNNVIAYIGHTTPTTIRKRKERIRKKLPIDLYEVIFGEKG